jgi:antirestriction protein ArdC
MPCRSGWVPQRNAADLVGHDEETAATLAAAITEALGQCQQRPAAARLEAAETVLEAWPVPTRWGGVRACYVPDLDRISMPAPEAFTTREAMVATWAHEQAHSTGHSSRLDRQISNSPGSQAYAREELVAELAAVLITYRLQIGCQLENHASYLSHWAQLLKDGGPRVLFQVLSDSRKAADLIAPEPPAEEA